MLTKCFLNPPRTQKRCLGLRLITINPFPFLILKPNSFPLLAFSSCLVEHCTRNTSQHKRSSAVPLETRLSLALAWACIGREQAALPLTVCQMLAQLTGPEGQGQPCPQQLFNLFVTSAWFTHPITHRHQHFTSSGEHSVSKSLRRLQRPSRTKRLGVNRLHHLKGGTILPVHPRRQCDSALSPAQGC